MHEYLCYAVYTYMASYITVRCTRSSFISYFAICLPYEPADHIQWDDQYFTDIETSNETTQKVAPWSCSVFNRFTWYFDNGTLFFHILTEDFTQSGQCECGVCLFVGKKWAVVGRQAGIRVTLLSAGPWSPGPQEEWWRWSSPTPLSAAPEGRLPQFPGPSSPKMGASGFCECPPTPSYLGFAACPDGRRTKGKVLFFW